MAQTYDQARVLICLYEHMSKDNCTRMSQQEIADKVQLSRASVNKHIQELIYAGYIIPDTKYASKYLIPPRGIDTAKRMKRLLSRRNVL